MREHYLHPGTSAHWGLSVAASPGGSEAEILKAARHLRQSHYRVAVAAELHELSDDILTIEADRIREAVLLSAVWDHNAHGLIVSAYEPTLEVASAISGVFGEPRVNPFHEERRQRHARR